MVIRSDKTIQEQVKRSEQEKRDVPIKINSQTIGVFNTTDYLIDNVNDFTFSGTDNGLVNLSTSVPFISQRF
jgi:nucleoside 2-deoxyribosyltransferase